MKKKWTFFLFAILLLFISGCSNDAEATNADGKIELDFWTFWGSETRRPIIEKMIDDFNNSQDEIVVKHTYVPWGDIWTKNLAAVAAGNPPDVIVNDIRSVALRAENNQVEDITDLMSDGLEEKFDPKLWETVVHEDKTYALPFNTDTRLLYYNKDAFREAGLDPEKPPRTWDELKEYAEKLNIKNGDTYEQVGFYPGWGDFGPISWMINADDGVQLIDDGEVKINTPAKQEALQWIVDFKEDLGEETVQNMSAEFGSEQQNPFINGKVAMWIEPGTFFTQLDQFAGDMDYGAALIPSFTEETGNWSSGGGFVLEIPKGAKNPEASMKFIEYMTDVEAQTYWAENNFDNVANIEASEKALDNLDGKAKEVYQKTLESLEETDFSTVPLEYPDYTDLVNPNIDDALQGDMSVEEALEKAQKDVEASKRETE
ncbi:ABC transporter substrate-binding protein [Oceanobacillus piezotolerans]|uniref:ABC transporter substrate-binding protein n=1 Tax=Oceanobacillus piezotolerans TaxID=2448030 RepID=A0A498DEF2_9BACI|nr:ABC transporter substrate-binding protein [Oceanobacillus piezotolerans]RLL47040.1 ABC transporter substrate-binding protein [Oceanobacillus piezotolerans]